MQLSVQMIKAFNASYVDAVADEHDAGQLTVLRSLLKCSYEPKCEI